MAKQILSFGELLWDILPNQTVLGGAPFNFAYRINSLGDQGLFAGSLGRDELGDKAYNKVISLGIDPTFLQRHPTFPTGTVDVTFDKDHMPDYVINPGVAYDYIQLTKDLLDAASHVECLCYGTLIQRAAESRHTLFALIDHASDAVKFLDINLRKDCFSKETIHYSLKSANILKLNDAEVLQLRDILELNFDTFPVFCHLLTKEYNLDYVLITLGKFGAFAHSFFGEEVYIPGYQIELADSLGSGDAFSAGFVHNILAGNSLETACELGNALGALVATTPGATAPVLQDDITHFLNTEPKRLYHPEFV